jgi:hypothetical protein
MCKDEAVVYTGCFFKRSHNYKSVVSFGDISVSSVFFFSFHRLGRAYRTVLYLSPLSGHVSYRKQFPCPEILLPVGALLSHSAR